MQPKALDRLRPGEARIKVFLGQQQTKLMLDLVQALQPFGPDAEYIPITGSGPDAVDFHIAYYMGQLAAQEPGVAFRIISRDRGFDPLVRHLLARGIDCQRLPEIPMPATPAALPAGPGIGGAGAPIAPAAKAVAKAPKKAAAKKKPAARLVVTVDPSPAKAIVPVAKSTTASRVKVVTACLAKSTKPSKVAGLRSSIKSWFKPPLDDRDVDAVLQSLQSSRKIVIDGTKVRYAAG